MNIIQKLSVLAFGFLLASCTSENTLDNLKPDGGSSVDEANRREVLLTLKNKLSLAPAKTKADDPIALAEENYLRSLDVYVFGSDKEDGTYTFQELYYYRDDASTLPAEGDWAHSFNLTAVDGKDNLSNGLLKLKKGLFVKLYCVANRTTLYQTLGDGTVKPYENFAALRQSNPGQADNKVIAGVPTEDDFVELHSRMISPNGSTEDDILQTPLPMTGSYVTPLDLTDFTVSTRTQLSFKLSRMVARFDVINNAEDSKFTIETISMGNGQPGAWFFPIKTLAAKADVISYPKRELAAETQTKDKSESKGAFYSWPSPKDDGGFLVLTGKYDVNKTEQKEVTYQIPFMQIKDGVGSFIEVAYNHRYTIEITKADTYHLDFTLNVTDWDDAGSIDDYEPDNNFDKNTKIVLDATAGATVNAYVLDNGTIAISPEDGSKFAFNINSSTTLKEELVYKTGSTKWLVADARTKAIVPAIEAQYTYKVDKDQIADPAAILPVTIRLTNPASGEHKDILVKPTAGPVISWTQAAENYNVFDQTSMTATLYNVTGQAITLKVISDKKVEGDVTTTGSSATISGTPNWLSIDPASDADNAETDYTLTVGSGGSASSTTTVDFTSTVSNKATQITVNLKDPEITALTTNDFTLGANNTLELSGGSSSNPKVTMTGLAHNSFTVAVVSPEGVTAAVTGGDDWLGIEMKDGSSAPKGKKQTIITATISSASANKDDGRITITNPLNNTTTVIDVKMELPTGPTVSLVDVAGSFSTYTSGAATLYNVVGQTIKLQTSDAATVTTTDATWLTLPSTKATEHEITVKTAQSAGSNGTITFTNDADGKTNVTVTLKDATITAPTDAEFSAGTGSNTFAAASGGSNAKVTMTDAANGNKFTLTITSPEGITAGTTDADSWLTIETGEKSGSSGSYTNVVTATVKDFSSDQSGTITLTNAISGGGNLTIDVEAKAPTVP